MQGVILGSKIRHSAARRRWAGQSYSEVLTSPVGRIRNHKQHAGYTCLGADTNHWRPWVRARLLPNSTFAVPHMSKQASTKSVPQSRQNTNRKSFKARQMMDSITKRQGLWTGLASAAQRQPPIRCGKPRKASETHRKQGCECPHLGLRALSIHPMSLKTRPLSDAGRDDRRASGPHKKDGRLLPERVLRFLSIATLSFDLESRRFLWTTDVESPSLHRPPAPRW